MGEKQTDLSTLGDQEIIELARNAVSEVEDEAQNLKAILMDSKTIIVRGIRRLPFRSLSEISRESMITIQPDSSEQACEWAIAGLTSIHFYPEQHAKETLRMPGAVELDEICLNAVAVFNEKKRSLVEVMTHIKSEDARRREVYAKFKGLSSSQARRVIGIASDTCPKAANITFRWHVGPGGKSKSAREWRNDLINKLAELDDAYSLDTFDSAPPPSGILAPREYAIYRDIIEVSRLDPEEKLIAARSVRPHIRVFVSSKLKKGRGKYFNTAIPLVARLGSIEKVNFAALDHAEKIGLKGKLSSRIENTPIISTLKYDVFRYKKEYR